MTDATLSLNALPVLAKGHIGKNQKFKNDGSLESVDNLLKKQAIACFKRVQAMGLGMEYNDVLQEMYVTYVKARSTWSPEGGAMFSTYVACACMNNFNAAIRKMERQRTIGIIKPTDKGVELSADGRVKHQRAFGMVSECEFTLLEEEGVTAYMDTAEGPSSDAPEFRLEQMQETKRKLSSLSAGARRLVQEMLRIENNQAVEDTKLSKIAAVAGLYGDELTQVKREISKTFGVRW